MKKFLIYLLRWQLSSPLLAICLLMFGDKVILGTIISNLIGGCIFYWIDKWIFKKKE